MWKWLNPPREKRKIQRQKLWSDLRPGMKIVNGCGPADGVTRAVYRVAPSHEMMAMTGLETKRAIHVLFSNGDSSLGHPDETVELA